MTVVLKNNSWLLIKLLVFGITGFYLYSAVQGRTDWFGLLRGHDNEQLRLLVFLATTLIPVNWGFEAWKWWYLAQKIEKVSFLRAFRSVMVGLTLGFITPNRVGDYAGRILELRSKKRFHAIGAIFLGRFAQLVITVLAGNLGGYYLFWHFYWPEFPLAKVSVGLFLLAANLLCLLLFFRATLILTLLGSFKPARRFLPYVRVLARYNFRELLNTLLLAGLRYAVFCLQFGLLLSAFGVEFSILKYVSAISSTFLLKSVMPSFSALTDVGMREVSAMHFFSLFGDPELNVLSASLSLWFLNIVVPSALGLIFVARLKLRKDPE